MLVELSLSTLQQRVVWIEAEVRFQRVEPLFLLPQVFRDELEDHVLCDDDPAVRVPLAGLYRFVLTEHRVDLETVAAFVAKRLAHPNILQRDDT